MALSKAEIKSQIINTLKYDGLSESEQVDKLMPLLNQLTSLSLRHCHLKLVHVKPLAEALAKNKSLRTLDVSANNIGQNSAVRIANVLKDNVTLRSLDFSHNKIGPQGVQAFAELIKHNQSLRRLNVSGCQIDSENTVVLANAVAENKSLSCFDISKNGAGSKGAQAFAVVLEKNNTLTSLNLIDNKFNENNEALIIKALKNNTALTALKMNLHDISIEKTGFVDFGYIDNVMKENNTLTELNFSKLPTFSKEKLARNKEWKEIVNAVKGLILVFMAPTSPFNAMPKYLLNAYFKKACLPQLTYRTEQDVMDKYVETAFTFFGNKARLNTQYPIIMMTEEEQQQLEEQDWVIIDEKITEVDQTEVQTDGDLLSAETEEQTSCVMM